MSHYKMVNVQSKGLPVVPTISHTINHYDDETGIAIKTLRTVDDVVQELNRLEQLLKQNTPPAWQLPTWTFEPPKSNSLTRYAVVDQHERFSVETEQYIKKYWVTNGYIAYCKLPEFGLMYVLEVRNNKYFVINRLLGIEEQLPYVQDIVTAQLFVKMLNDEYKKRTMSSL